jgi:hypothetical protein
MSSQGPASSTDGTTTGAPTGTTGTVVPNSYAWNQVVIRDASDWIKFKKQAIIYKENQSGPAGTENPWIPYGNDYRLDFMDGKRKCDACTGTAFSGNGIPPSS